jgi:hypothetical protein
MKTLREYIAESQQWIQSPAEGDDFAFELPDETICETYIIEVADDCILLDSTEEINAALAEWAALEDTDEGDSGVIMETMGYGTLVGEEDKEVAEDQDAAVLAGKEAAIDAAQRLATDEAEYQGRKVPLGKPMRGDVKKFKVYVKDPKTGNVKKVNFGHGGTSAKRAGQKTMKIKKSNPARRKSFRARHNCANPGPRTKARYWSCRAW